ncbi:hypothetical protein CJP74_04850 [Psittacicella melopsittaci]|uniref:ABC transporter domain-containing protein n=1 Tax=Psittacicella melopsittaci TaxID=2028576 RepID=A0A3A1Y541_9GAMM|nr:ATP-binding cassette domain-containing protein [Psittacicella melopsittaci]RIY32328.1 hypothetical protein CJP74_04850 [Psittacicella melopsittaci]
MTIRLENVLLQRGKQEFTFNLEIPQGQKVAIIGQSGAGKSTLINLIAGFIPLQKGKIYINDKEVSRTLPSERGCVLVFQDNNHFPHLNMYKNVALAFTHSKLPKAQQQQQIEQMFSYLNISEVKDKLPKSCSGGQLQRAALARGFLFPRSILLLDEPLSALDPENAANVVNYLKEQQQTMLIVTHDLEAVKPLVDRIITISEGQVIADQVNLAKIKPSVV